RFIALYDYKGLQKKTAWIPDPYARTTLASEFTRPDGLPTDIMPRRYHHLELTGTAGALWWVSEKLKVRLGAGARNELTASSSSPEPFERELARTRFLAEAGATLDPMAITTVAGRAMRLEGSFDYHYSDPTELTEHELRFRATMSLPILPLLFF